MSLATQSRRHYSTRLVCRGGARGEHDGPGNSASSVTVMVLGTVGRSRASRGEEDISKSAEQTLGHSLSETTWENYAGTMSLFRASSLSETTWENYAGSMSLFRRFREMNDFDRTEEAFIIFIEHQLAQEIIQAAW